MEPEVVEKLQQINQQFYQTFGEAFSATRGRIQPGVGRVLDSIPGEGDWLDIGCGNGTLAVEWARRRFKGSYVGMDFSIPMLESANNKLRNLPNKEGLTIQFSQSDLTDPNWESDLPSQSLDGVLAFAVLHHIPSRVMRGRILRQLHRLLRPEGRFIHSEWQFQHSPKLMARVQPWSRIGLNESQVEEGDTLLDWRASLPGQVEGNGLRYVHLFSRDELGRLAKENGFAIVSEFESDGHGRRLGLYQAWMKLCSG